MISLPKQPTPPTNINPRILLLYGATKVGKTRSLESLDGCLIIDTEKGTRGISGMKVEISSLKELMDLIKELKKPENKDAYKYIAIDTLDNITMWIEKHVLATNLTKDGTPCKSLSDIPYGGGWSQVRDKTLEVVKTLADLTDHCIVIAHRDRKIIGETNVEVSVTNLDLPGKLRNQLMAGADAIGYVYRDEKSELRVSFVRVESGDKEVEAGSRIRHLENRDLPLDWKEIYK